MIRIFIGLLLFCVSANGQTINRLGTGSGGGITVGNTAITGGVDNCILFDSSSKVGCDSDLTYVGPGGTFTLTGSSGAAAVLTINPTSTINANGGNFLYSIITDLSIWSSGTERPNMFSSKLIPSVNTSNVYQNFSSFLQTSGPGQFNGEINLLLSDWTVDAGVVHTADSEDLEVRVDNSGTMGNYKGVFSFFNNTSTGIVNQVFGLKCIIVNANTTPGSINTAGCIDNEAPTGAGSQPTNNYFIRNADANASVVTSGKIAIGTLAVQNPMLVVVGPDTSTTIMVNLVNSALTSQWSLTDAGVVQQAGVLNLNNGGTGVSHAVNTGGTVLDSFRNTNATGAAAYQMQLGNNTSATQSTFAINSSANTTTGAGIANGTTWTNAGTLSVTGGSTVSYSVDNTGKFFLNTAASDSGATDATLCRRTSNGELIAGSGTLGICLGTSSERYKNNVADLDFGLGEILRLKPKSYFLNPDHGDSNKLYFGFIAEDSIDVLPALTGVDEEGRPNTFDYLGIVPVLVKAIQEQQIQINSLKRKLEYVNLH